MVREMMGRYSWSSSGAGAGGCGGGEGDMSMTGSGNGNVNVKPAWLEGLMAETFFGGCGVHQNQRKNEKNVFCLHCCLSICPHCLPSHRSHPLLQVVLYIQSLILILILVILYAQFFSHIQFPSSIHSFSFL